MTVTAFGLHELTGSPGDLDRATELHPGHRDVVPPRPHIAYGIFWIGAGGIIGIDRRADTDALRERLTSGAVGNILFAEDPVRNAPVILGDLATLFPPAGIHVFGLTIQLGWIPLKSEYLARLAVGVIIEFDSITRPLKVIVLGSLRIAGVRFERLLDIQVDVVGVFDLGRRTLEVDATIRRGVVMGVFKVTGDGGLRASWGDRPYLMATLGGFHPDFHPEPAVLPVPQADPHHRRRGPAAGRHRAERVGLHGHHLEHDPVRRRVHRGDQERQLEIEGKIGGDALIRLPFYFDVTIKGGVHVKYRGRNLVGVEFKGGLRGRRRSCCGARCASRCCCSMPVGATASSSGAPVPSREPPSPASCPSWPPSSRRPAT